jgi:hypothetical protein
MREQRRIDLSAFTNPWRMPLAELALDFVWSRLCLSAEYSDRASVDRLIAEGVESARELPAVSPSTAL